MTSKSIVALLAVQAILSIASNALIPTLPFYLLELGGDAFTLALNGTLWCLFQVFGCPGIAVLSDFVDRKKILMTTLGARVVIFILVAQSTQVWQVLALWCVLAVCCSTGPVETAYLMESTNSEELMKLLVIQRLLGAMGAIIGPLVAKVAWPLGFPVICYGVSVTCAICGVIGSAFWSDMELLHKQRAESGMSPVFFRARSSKFIDSTTGSPGSPGFPSPATPITPSMVKTIWGSKWYKILSGPRTSMMLITTHLLFLGMAIGEGPEVVFFKDHFGYSQNDLSNLMLVMGISGLVLTSLIKPIIDCLGVNKSVVWSILGSGVMNVFLISGAGQKWVPCAFAALSSGLFGNLITIGLMEVIRQMCSKDSLSAMLALDNFAMNLAGVIAPAMGGAIYAHNNFLPYWIRAGMYVFCAFFVGMMLVMPEQEPLPKKASSSNKKGLEIEDDEGGEEEEDTSSDEDEVPLAMLAGIPQSRSTVYMQVLSHEYLLTQQELKNAYIRSNKLPGHPNEGMHRAQTICQENWASSATAPKSPLDEGSLPIAKRRSNTVQHIDKV